VPFRFRDFADTWCGAVCDGAGADHAKGERSRFAGRICWRGVCHENYDHLHGFLIFDAPDGTADSAVFGSNA